MARDSLTVSKGKIELMPEYTTLTEAATAALQAGLGPIEEAGLPMGPTVVKFTWQDQDYKVVVRELEEDQIE
jgi:hypothetical protein